MFVQYRQTVVPMRQTINQYHPQPQTLCGQVRRQLPAGNRQAPGLIGPATSRQSTENLRAHSPEFSSLSSPSRPCRLLGLSNRERDKPSGPSHRAPGRGHPPSLLIDPPRAFGLDDCTQGFRCTTVVGGERIRMGLSPGVSFAHTRWATRNNSAT